MKIQLTVDAKECPYWDYEAHTCSHTCGGCVCMTEGNHLTACGDLVGVRIGEDRYCLLGDVRVEAKIIEAVTESEPIKARWVRSFDPLTLCDSVTCSNCYSRHRIPRCGVTLPTVCEECKAVMIGVE